jgi:hypothetical protein
MDWRKVAIGAAIAIGGSTLTYVTTVVIPAMEASGDATLLALAAGFSIAINIYRNYRKAKNAGT